MRVSSRWLLWYLPAGAASAAAILLGVGFWLALRGSAGAPLGAAAPAPVTPRSIALPSGRRLLLILGDSLARGTGDEKGRGFAGDVEDFVKRRGSIESVNLAVNGAESGDVRQTIESSNVRSLAASADWILLSAGGNDLSHSVPRGTEITAAAVGEIAATRQRFLENLREILSILRQANAVAPIVWIGLYDPFGGEGRAAQQGASVILSWNDAAQETALAFPNVFVVPTFDLFAGRSDRLSGDHFHPNGDGYAEIARRIEQVLPVDRTKN